MSDEQHAGVIWDVIVVGGGPAGATAATDLARTGRSVLLLDRAGRIKPCGGAVPPRLLDDFEIPPHLVVAQVNKARMVSPTARNVDMPIESGFVGMVDREVFDEWLRERARLAGCTRIHGECVGIERLDDGGYVLRYRPSAAASRQESTLRARTVIGADGAASAIARQRVPDAAARVKYVAAYHEIITAPEGSDPQRCDVFYCGRTLRISTAGCFRMVPR